MLVWLFNTFHDDEPVVDDSQFKEGNPSHEDVVKVVEEIIVGVEGGVVILIELLHCGVPVDGSRGSSIYNFNKYSLTYLSSWSNLLDMFKNK